MRTLTHYRFRYFNQLRKRWVMARYVCSALEIRCRYSDYELVGPPEVRHVPDDPLANSVAHPARVTSSSRRSAYADQEAVDPRG